MPVKLFVREWMKVRGITGAYQLVQRIPSKAAVGEATIYRLVRSDGQVDSVKADTLKALAKVFECEVADLFRQPKPEK